jgi:hypothetical protein
MFPGDVRSERLFDAHIDLETPLNIGSGPYGRRSIHTISGGTFEGPRMMGTVLAGGGDWLLSSPGHNELDVRLTLKVSDGALIYMSYRGVLKVDPQEAARAMAGDDLGVDAYYFRTTPRFETGHESYAWLNSLITVAYGYFGPGKVGYRVFAV